MNEARNDLASLWRSSMSTQNGPVLDAATVINIAVGKKASNIFSYLMTILILSVDLLALMAFFYFVAPFQHLFSRIGVAFMLLSIMVRIIFEINALIKFQKLDLSQAASDSANSHLTFYRFRKFVHGPVTLTVLAFHTIGFYMLSPEFSIYLERSALVFYDCVYAVAGIILFILISRGVKREMKNLADLAELQDEFADNGPEAM